MTNVEEIWKNVEGYNGLYQISSTSRVRRVKSVLPNKNGTFKHNGGIVKPALRVGYFCVCLSQHSKRKHHRINRLVAKAFIKNPDNLPQVNHINGIKTDNRLENLEWCTPSQNILHAYKMGMLKPQGVANPLRKHSSAKQP